MSLNGFSQGQLSKFSFLNSFNLTDFLGFYLVWLSTISVLSESSDFSVFSLSAILCFISSEFCRFLSHPTFSAFISSDSQWLLSYPSLNSLCPHQFPLCLSCPTFIFSLNCLSFSAFILLGFKQFLSRPTFNSLLECNWLTLFVNFNSFPQREVLRSNDSAQQNSIGKKKLSLSFHKILFIGGYPRKNACCSLLKPFVTKGSPGPGSPKRKTYYYRPCMR